MSERGDSLKILSWAEEDRPREKLLLKGKSALSDAELIAILIGSGTRSLSAVDVAKIILTRAENDLNQLAKFSVKDLQKIKGIGEAKAISIVSALELGRRRKDADFVQKGADRLLQ
jgi:DNA repair protein RadC